MLKQSQFILHTGKFSFGFLPKQGLRQRSRALVGRMVSPQKRDPSGTYQWDRIRRKDLYQWKSTLLKSHHGCGWDWNPMTTALKRRRQSIFSRRGEGNEMTEAEIRIILPRALEVPETKEVSRLPWTRASPKAIRSSVAWSTPPFQISGLYNYGRTVMEVNIAGKARKPT